jgi:uncharacterized OsmC-like protein
VAVDDGGCRRRADQEDATALFTQFTLSPRVTVPPGTSEALAARVLQQAKRKCLVTNSLRAACELSPNVSVVANDEAPAGI